MDCWACADGDCDDCTGPDCTCECRDDPWEDPDWQDNPYLWLDPPRPIVTVELPGVSR